VVKRRCTDNTWVAAASTSYSEARYRLRIAISVYLTCIRHPPLGEFSFNIAMPFGVEKQLEWFSYSIVKKFWREVDSFWQNVTYEHDRQTHTQTPHDDIGRTCIASRGKNYIHTWFFKQSNYAELLCSLIPFHLTVLCPLSTQKWETIKRSSLDKALPTAGLTGRAIVRSKDQKLRSLGWKKGGHHSTSASGATLH